MKETRIMATMSPKLPLVLQQTHGNSISMERALKQIKELLEQCDVQEKDEQAVLNSIDDVNTMLNSIDRG